MYVLYGFPGSRTTRVTWMLEEVGADYEFVVVRPRSKAALGVNPTGKLPVLKVDGKHIIDSVAICSFLADRNFSAGLTFEAGSVERAQLDSWLHFAQNDLEAPLWMRTRQVGLLPKDMRTPDILKLCDSDWAFAIRAMEARLGENEYVMGAKFTVADIILGHILRWAKGAKLDVASDSVAAYLGRVQQRPALAKAIEREASAKVPAT